MTVATLAVVKVAVMANTALSIRCGAIMGRVMYHSS